MKAYWFSDDDGWTENMKGNFKFPAKVGRTHRVDGELIPCERGLHASPTPFDALQYACGNLLWEVEIPHTAIPHGEPVDKHVSHTRTYIRSINTERICRNFSAQCALKVLHLWDAPELVLEYLNDEAIGIDRSDIRAAAGAVAGAVAGDAARAAAWAAARDAAWAAWDESVILFNSMVIDAIEEVARDDD